MGIPRQIEIGDRPELLEFIKQTASSDGSVQLLDNGLPVAVISSLAGSSHLLARTKPVTADDPLFRLVGIGESETPGDAAEHKNEYLVRAKRSLTE